LNKLPRSHTFLETLHSSPIRRVKLPEGFVDTERPLKSHLARVIGLDGVGEEGAGFESIIRAG
jgi:hypothetical protein